MQQYYPAQPTPYDRRQNKGAWSTWIALFVIIGIVGLIAGLWSLINSLSLGGINNLATQNEKDIKELRDLFDDYQLLSEKAQPNGYAPLNLNSIVPDVNLPPELLDAALYRGCWDAAINFPVLTSSAGTNGEFFIVCISGSTTLNGFDTWNLYDIAIFDGGLNQWIRIDGGVNTISNVSPPTGDEFTLIAEGTGPFFELYKVEADGDLEITLVGGDTLLFNATSMAKRSIGDIERMDSHWGHYHARVEFVPVLMKTYDYNMVTLDQKAVIKAFWLPGLSPITKHDQTSPVSCQYHRIDTNIMSTCTVDFNVDDNAFKMMSHDDVCKGSQCELESNSPMSVKMKIIIDSFTEKPRASNIPLMGMGTLQQMDMDTTTVLRNCGHFSAYLEKDGSTPILSGEISPSCNDEGSVWKLTWSFTYESIGIN